ncbi:Golgi apparatus protein 1-like isoform X2 [Patiria miniata]|uniref:Golgi apparatus protein 1 n=1 Tax=Patiria miniata TaxID=46514 RepID=A0A914BM13_PATMI|nr:Golgi apparatus protein 1-like isoform X2 [Patiria miniata]
MASDLRVLLVTYTTLCLFSSICAVFGQQDGVRNDPGAGQIPAAAGWQQTKRDVAPVAGGQGQGPLGGIAAGVGNGAQPQYQQQQKLRINPGQGLGAGQRAFQKPAPGQFDPNQKFDQGNQRPNVGLPGQGPGAGPGGMGGQGQWAPKPVGQQPQGQWQGGQQPQGKPKLGPNRPMRISESPACHDDVANLCGKNALRNNFSILECLQNAGENTRAGKKDGGELSDVCNQFLWSYKYNLTRDVRFDSAAFEVCKPDLKKLPECAAIEKGQGLLLPCLYEVAENITTVQCRQYINRMKAITFSDYRLIKDFYTQCQSDVDKLGCGIVYKKGEETALPHKQGATINCLEKKIEELGETCKKQILRVAELTAEDYHTDRALFFACRDDRERFCEAETAGQGAIYNCLLKHKFKEDMSENCRNKLTTRQKVASVDYKANYRLIRKCKEDMKKTKCAKLRDSQGREFRLSKLLICLEEAKHNDVKLSGDCVAELEETRKSLMEDFMVNPEVITQCKKEMANQCSGLQRGGKTLHCLMKLTQGNPKDPKKLSDNCETALMQLVKTADAGANYRIDKALHKACKPVRDKICKEVEAGDAKVLSCLMEHIYDPEMTKECETELLLLQYFVSRDFKLDPLLYKNCKRDVQDLCFTEDFENSNLPEGVVFACLHRHLHPDDREMTLQPGCQAQVHRLLRQRAVSVHLNPQIEANCRSDIGQYCADKTGKGEELSCLQEHHKELSDDCKSKIGGFTEEEAEDIKMNRKLMAACAPMIKQFCKDFLSKKVDEGAALQCLIDHKNDDEMNEKCQAGIEHFQLIQLQDYRFNFKFKESCRKDVIAFCKTSKDKSSIVNCLSSKVRDDTLKDNPQNISEECRKQLKAELLQRSEDIKLDPELFQGCEDDVKKLCSNLKAGKARILECLRDHRKELGEKCHLKLFNRVKEQAQNVKTDFAFMHSCQRMIKQFCPGTAPDSLFKCLKAHKNEPSFDPNCKAVLTKRSIQKKEDFRLNPRMQKACRRDMPKFCNDILDKSKTKEYQEKSMEGEMLLCLKTKFVVKQLSPDCENYVKDTIQEASLDIRMDPILYRVCKDTARKLCGEQMESPGQGQVEECLKSKLHEGKVHDIKCRMQVIRLLQEGRADIHVDTLLYKACALDIKHFCVGIPQGEGRQMSCILEALEDTTIKLHPDCRRMLAERKETWSYAVKESPPGSLSDLAAMVNASEARGYFLTVLLVIIGVLFFGGLCCGRATKRIRAELKNK